MALVSNQASAKKFTECFATTATAKALSLPRLTLGRITLLRVGCFIRPTIGKGLTHETEM